MLGQTLEWWGIAVLIVFLNELNLFEFALAGVSWKFRQRLFRNPLYTKAGAVWRWLALRPALACVLIGCAPIVVRLALLPILPVPQPAIADEFSHLLLADTFLHGRLTNPVHPMWVHFESIHILQQPSYNSMYFPGQAVVLMLGALAGSPWIGILAATGLMCGLIVWALQPFMPNRWAVLAGVIGALRFGIIGYWVNSYWGGPLAAVGGALVLGSYGRITRRPTIGLGLLLGLGFAIAGIVRPMEGLVFALPFACALVSQTLRGLRFGFALRTLIPAALVIGLIFAGVGVFFKAVTGDPLVSGYAINQKTYGWPLVMPWQKPNDPDFRHQELRVYYEWERTELSKKTTLKPIITFTPFRLSMGWIFFFGPVLSIGLFHLRRTLLRPKMRIIAISSLGCIAIVFVEAGFPHYLAPATAGLLGIAVQCLRYARASRTAPVRGWVTVPLVITTLTAVVAMHVVFTAFHIPYMGGGNPYLSWCKVSTAGQTRKMLEEKVAANPGQHVIFVKYHHTEFKSLEWVYNTADIDGQRVVWARDMGAERNKELVRYYQGRTFWTVDADDTPTVVKPYSVTAPAGTTVADSRGR